MRVAIQGSGADLRVCSRLLIENGHNDDGKNEKANFCFKRLGDTLSNLLM